MIANTIIGRITYIMLVRSACHSSKASWCNLITHKTKLDTWHHILAIWRKSCFNSCVGRGFQTVSTTLHIGKFYGNKSTTLKYEYDIPKAQVECMVTKQTCSLSICACVISSTKICLSRVAPTTTLSKYEISPFLRHMHQEHRYCYLLLSRALIFHHC